MRLLLLCSALLLIPAGAAAQARQISAPPDNYLLEITQTWALESPLGDLRVLSMKDGDIELRLWSGYGVVGTSGLVLRRDSGRWFGWRVAVHTCSLELPISVGDTLSEASEHRYRQVARARCDEPERDDLSAATVIQTDTLELVPMSGSLPYQETWEAVVQAGLLRLPTKIPRAWEMLDGHTYVVEVRQGDTYRASVIEHTSLPETEDDRRVQEIYRAVMQQLRTDL